MSAQTVCRVGQGAREGIEGGGLSSEIDVRDFEEGNGRKVQRTVLSSIEFWARESLWMSIVTCVQAVSSA